MTGRNEELTRLADEIEEAARKMQQRSHDLMVLAAQVRDLGQRRNTSERKPE